MGVFFYVGSLFSPRGCHFSVCERGGGVGLLSAWGERGGGGELLGLPPITIFVRAFCCHIFYCTDFIIFPDRGGLNFLRELFDPPKKLPPSPPPPSTN